MQISKLTGGISLGQSIKRLAQIASPGSRGGRGYWKSVRHVDGTASIQWVYGTPSTQRRGNPAPQQGGLLQEGSELEEDPTYTGNEEEHLHYGIPAIHDQANQVTAGGFDSESDPVPSSDIDGMLKGNIDWINNHATTSVDHAGMSDIIRREQQPEAVYSPLEKNAPSTTVRAFLETKTETGSNGEQITTPVVRMPYTLQLLAVSMMVDEARSKLKAPIQTSKISDDTVGRVGHAGEELGRHSERDTGESGAYIDGDDTQYDPTEQDEHDENDNLEQAILDYEDLTGPDANSERDRDDTARSNDLSVDRSAWDGTAEDQEDLETRQRLDPLAGETRAKDSSDISRAGHVLNENDPNSPIAEIISELKKNHLELNRIEGDNPDKPTIETAQKFSGIKENALSLDDFIALLQPHKSIFADSSSDDQYKEWIREHIQRAHLTAISADMGGWQIIPASSVDIPDSLVTMTPGFGPPRSGEPNRYQRGGSPLVYFLRGDKDLLHSTKITAPYGDSIPGFTKADVENLDEMINSPNSNFSALSRKANERLPGFKSKQQLITRLASTLDILGLDWNNDKWKQLWNSGGLLEGKQDRRSLTFHTPIESRHLQSIEDLFIYDINPRIEEKKEQTREILKQLSDNGHVLCITTPERDSSSMEFPGYDPNEIAMEEKDSFSSPVIVIPSKEKFMLFGGKPEDYSNGTKNISEAQIHQMIIRREVNSISPEDARKEIGLENKIEEMLLDPKRAKDLEGFLSLTHDLPIMIRHTTGAASSLDMAIGIQSIYRNSSEEEKKMMKSDLASACFKWCNDNNTDIVTPDDRHYPYMLRGIGNDAPQILFMRHGGNRDLLDRLGLSPENENSPRLVATVGTRNVGTQEKGKWKGDKTFASSLVGRGREFATRIASGLSQRGWTIVSGLADGIDSISHSAAINSPQVAILGGGVDGLHISGATKKTRRSFLMDEILKNGGVLVSERLPGHMMGKNAGADLTKRNRLQTGMSAGTIVVESPATAENGNDTGTMRTVDSAVHQGRFLATVDPSAWQSGIASARTRVNNLVSGNQKIIREIGAYAIKGHDDISIDTLSNLLLQSHQQVADKVSDGLQIAANGYDGSGRQHLVDYPSENTQLGSWDQNNFVSRIRYGDPSLVVSPFPVEIFKRAYDYSDPTEQMTENERTLRNILGSPSWESISERTGNPFSAKENNERSTYFRKQNLGKFIQQALAENIAVMPMHISSSSMDAIIRANADHKKIFYSEDPRPDTREKENSFSWLIKNRKAPKRAEYLAAGLTGSRQSFWHGFGNYWDWAPVMDDQTGNMITRTQDHVWNNLHPYSLESIVHYEDENGTVHTGAGFSNFSQNFTTPEREKQKTTDKSFANGNAEGIYVKKRMQFDPSISIKTFSIGTRSSPIRIEVKKQLRNLGAQGKTSFPCVFSEITMYNKSTNGKYSIVARHNTVIALSNDRRLKTDSLKTHRDVDRWNHDYAALMLAEYATRSQRFVSEAKKQARLRPDGTIRSSEVVPPRDASDLSPHEWWGMSEATGPQIPPNTGPLGDAQGTGFYATPARQSGPAGNADYAVVTDQFIAHNSSRQDENQGSRTTNTVFLDKNLDLQQQRTILGTPAHSIYLGMKDSFQYPNSTQVVSPTPRPVIDLQKIPQRNLLGITSGQPSNDWYGKNTGRAERTQQIKDMIFGQAQNTELTTQWLKNLSARNVHMFFVPYSPFSWRNLPKSLSAANDSSISLVAPSITVAPSSSKSINEILVPISSQGQSISQGSMSIPIANWREQINNPLSSGSVQVNEEIGYGTKTGERTTVQRTMPGLFLVFGTTTTGNSQKDIEHMYICLGNAANCAFTQNIGPSNDADQARLLSDSSMIAESMQSLNTSNHELYNQLTDSQIASSSSSQDPSVTQRQRRAILFAKMYMRSFAKKIGLPLPFQEVETVSQQASQQFIEHLQTLQTTIDGFVNSHCEQNFSGPIYPSFAQRTAGSAMSAADDSPQTRKNNNSMEYDPIAASRAKMIAAFNNTPVEYQIDEGRSHEIKSGDKQLLDSQSIDAALGGGRPLYTWIDEVAKSVKRAGGLLKSAVIFSEMIKEPSLKKVLMQLKLAKPNNFSYPVIAPVTIGQYGSTIDNAGIENHAFAVALFSRYMEEKENYPKWMANKQYSEKRTELAPILNKAPANRTDQEKRTLLDNIKAISYDAYLYDQRKKRDAGEEIGDFSSYSDGFIIDSTVTNALKDQRIINASIPAEHLNSPSARVFSVYNSAVSKDPTNLNFSNWLESLKGTIDSGSAKRTQIVSKSTDKPDTEKYLNGIVAKITGLQAFLAS